MKILILTPIWKRPEIVRLFVKSLSRLKFNYDMLFIVSPEDPFRDEIISFLPSRAFITGIENFPFGRKKNHGLAIAKTLKWDYLLELNSDSIVNPKLMDIYRPYMDRGVPFFGLNNLYVIDYYTKKAVFIPAYNSTGGKDVMSYGSGQMLARSACPDRLWEDNLNEGMDTNKICTLRMAGVDETVVDCGDTPMIIDIKTNTTITHFKMLEKMAEKEVAYDFLKQQIGYDFISS